MLLFGDYILRRYDLPSKFSDVASFPELILISPRKGAGKREIINPDELRQAVEVGIREPVIVYEFGSMYETMNKLASSRILISPHGAGMSNIIFMRVGTSVLETDSYLCDSQGDYYGELARTVNVNHKVWTEKHPPSPRSSCDFQAFVLLDVSEICKEVVELLEEDTIFRDSHMQHAMNKIAPYKTESLEIAANMV